MKSYWKLGCRWGSKSKGKPLFFDLLIKYGIVISWENKDYRCGGNILLTDGHTVLGVARTTDTRKPVFDFPHYKEEFEALQIEYCQDLYVYNAYIIKLDLNNRFRFQTQTGICGINKKEIRDRMDSILAFHRNDFEKMLSIKKYIDLVKYKKQIILQGPPGTGKTKLAKEIAREIIGFTAPLNNDKELNEALIKNFIKVGQNFNSVHGNTSYKVKDVLDNKIILSGNDIEDKSITYNKIIEVYNLGRWQRSLDNGNDRGAGAIAKYIYDNIAERIIKSKIGDSEQFKLVQFHPSYTYEDFVRGIVSESKGENIEYKNINKTLGLFAEEALKNYLDSKKDVATISKESSIKSHFEAFKEYLNDKIENAEGYFSLTKSVGLISTDDENAFRYKGENEGWLKNGNRILHKDILQAYSDGNLDRQDIKKNQNISGLARQHASYFVRVLNLFQEFLDKNKLKVKEVKTSEKVALQNYVLIIDEINRANLSSVLGELIYALEYRGEAVASMYAVEDSINEDKSTLILPPNLYIIGTMNTADRSLGHIDYAIRRRFAFVDVLPEYLNTNDELIFHSNLFRAVSEMFVKDFDPEIKYTAENTLNNDVYLSSEFEAKDVWLGHSYFIQIIEKDEKGNQLLIPENMELRLEYEIKPILMEYVKDGVLKPSAIDKIKELTI
ncbi:AAA family ATPase [Pseudopedobacter beijingensis]|uniref:AAA family ATPase n=1 Tax=Pseudopedobacter beijingensis TaxID=1207056 RepID=A0ABW4IDY3_9SPHI